MSGFNVPLSDITNMVLSIGYPVVTDRYNPQSLYYPQFTRVVAVDPSTGAGTSDGLLGHREGDLVGGTAAEVSFGQEIPAFSMGNGYLRQVKGRKYGGALKFPREAFATPQAQATIGRRIENLVGSTTLSIIRLKEQLAADILQYGVLSAGRAATFDQSFDGAPDPYPTKSYDNVSFFNSAHPIKLGSSTYSNITVSAALSATTLATVQTAMASTNAVDERGNRISVMPDLLVVPPGLKHTALTIVNSALVPGTANNDINTLQGEFQVLSNPYLTVDADGWFALDRQLGPILAIDSGAPTITVWESDGGQTISIGVYSYFGAAPWDWRGAYAANLATS